MQIRTTVLIGIAFVNGVLYANIAEPNLEKFNDYLNKNTELAEEIIDKKLANSIKYVLRSAKLPPHKRQNLLIKLGKSYLQQTSQAQHADTNFTNKVSMSKEMRKNLFSAANAFRKAVNLRGTRRAKNKAMFYLALTLSRLGSDNATFYYKELKKYATDHQLLPYVNLSYAEHLYAKGKYRQAEKLYMSAVGHQEHPAYPYSVYKLAYVYFHLAKHDKTLMKKSISSLKLLVNLDYKQNMQQDALTGLVDFWSEMQDTESAKKYFVSTNNDTYYFMTMEKLARKFLHEKKPNASIATYKQLVSSAIHLVDSPKYLHEMLNLLFRLKKYQTLVSYLQRIERTYFDKRSVWYVTNNTNMQKVYWQNYLDKMLYDYAKKFYELGTSLANSDMYKYARDILKTYLLIFPEDSNSLNAKFLLAEILYNFNYLEKAANYYSAVALTGERSEPLVKLAGMSAVRALEKLATQHNDDKVGSREIEKQLKQAMATYISLFPNDVETKGLLLASVQLELKHKQEKQAKHYLQMLIKSSPDSSEAEQAINKLLRVMVSNKQWQEIIAWADSNKEFRRSFNEATDKTIADTYKLANLYFAMHLQNTKRYLLAAEQFDKYKTLFPKDKRLGEVLLSAGKNYFMAGKIKYAVDSYSFLLDKFPQSKQTVEALILLAQIEEKLGDFEKAAHYYLEFSKRQKESKFNYQALAKAMRYYFYLGKYKKAIAVADYIQSVFRSLPDTFYAELAKIYLQDEQYDKVWGIYKNLLVYTHAQIEDVFLDVLQGLEQHDNIKYVEDRLSTRDTTDYEKRLLAKIKFNRLHVLSQAFLLQDIRTAKTIDKEIRDRQSKLLRLVSAFDEVIKIGNAEYQAMSFYRLGELHEGFADMILQVPTLYEATQQEINTHQSKLEKVSFPMKNEAFKYYLASYQKSQSAKIFNDYLLKAYKKISKSAPERYPVLLEKTDAPMYLTHKFYLNKSTRVLLQ